LLYQDFEEGNGSAQYGWGFNGASAGFSSGEEPVHDGARSWKMTSPGLWGGTGIPSQIETWDMNFQPDRHDRLTFWIYALPDESSESLDNNVSVKFFDRENYNSTGFEVWTSKAAQYGAWTRLTVLFSQLPQDFNLNRIDKIEFINYYPGTYYLDDIQVVSEDRMYQSFEPIVFEPGFTGEEYEKFGWAWNGTVDLFVDNQIVLEGLQSWMLDTLDLWGGTGIRSQEKKLVLTGQGYEQSPWHVDLLGVHGEQLPEDSPYDRLTFWVYSLAENGLDNTLSIQFFDHNNYPEDFEDPERRNPYVIWTEQPAVYGEWTKFTIPFDALPPDLELHNLNKLQFQVYWKGRYFFDDLRAAKPCPVIDKAALANGEIQWPPVPGADLYTVEQSVSGPGGPWQNVYSGAGTSFPAQRVSPAWYRVRWEEAEDSVFNPVAYVSDWSEVAYYAPAPVLLNHASLKGGALQWTDLPQADRYEVEMATGKKGPWQQIYNGPRVTLSALNGKWYRVRALIEESGAVVDSSEWSPVQSYSPGAGYLKVAGKLIKEQDGWGDTIILRGFNLANYLLIEPWMTGIRVDDPARSEDDWNIREKLSERFGPAEAGRLLGLYQEAYIQEADFDNIMRSGANVIRLPIYYRVIREIDEQTGQWLAGSDFNFEQIDRVVNFCADRGIYVLLDLHGAPGAQNKEYHSGRTSAGSPGEGFYHQLFNPATGVYRQRTIELWEALAQHYKDNTAVMGYDLLNEPFGAIDPLYYPDIHDGYEALGEFYDQLYSAVRQKDPHHIIVMEAIPVDKDWDTLPDPADYNWQNVVYQFHYYGFKFNSAGKIDGVLDRDQQALYLVSGNDPACEQYPDDDKFCGKVLYSKQDEYDVPVLIGEFSGFNQRENWDLYLKTFNKEGWSWTMWSYKHHPPREEWGLYTHRYYNDEAPNVGADDITTLEQKFSLYDTLSHHELNVSLGKILGDYFSREHIVTQPAVAGRTPEEVKRKWYKVHFEEKFKKTPVLIAGIETFNGPDTAGVRMKGVNKGGFQVKLEEERSGDPEVWHLPEVVSYFAVQPGTILDDEGAVIGEAGHVTGFQRNGSQWHTVTLKNEYTDPVVFMQIVTYHGRQPSHIRLRNVDSTSFQYQIEEWDYLDQKHLMEKIAFIVLEKGSHALTNGLGIEVGAVNVDHSWSSVVYGGSYSTAPVTVSQCQTYQEEGAVVMRERNVSETGFEVRLQEEEGGDGVHALEEVGYIAVYQE